MVFVKSVIRRHRGSLLWKNKTSVNSFVQTDTSGAFCSLLKCKNNEDLLRTAMVNPVLPVTIKATGASEKGCKYY